MGAVSPLLTKLFNDIVAGNFVSKDLYALGDLFNPNYVPALADLYAASSPQMLYAWRLYTITPASGPVMRFADGDFDVLATATTGPVPISGFTYPSSTIKIDAKQSKTQAHWKIGLDVDQYTLVVMPRPFDPVTGAQFPDRIGNVPWLQAASAGALDAADFQVDEAYFGSLPTWPMPPRGAQPIGCKTIFHGVIAEVDTTNAIASLTVNDYRYLFSIQMPRHFYQAQCRHALFDSGCNASGNMNAAAFAKNGVVGAGSTQSTIIGVKLAAPPSNPGSGTYALGRIVMTSGLNSGFSRTITNWDLANTLSLLNPLPFAVAAGDTFTVYPGCNKTLVACAAFANQFSFGGAPFVPPPEVQG